MGTLFEGEVTFNSIECDGYGFFCILDADEQLVVADVKRTLFEASKTMDLSFASFGRYLSCRGATFNDIVSFKHIRCEGDGDFTYAHFEGDSVDFSFTHFGGSLTFEGAQFDGSVDMTSARISQDLILSTAEGAAYFNREVVLYDASISELVLEGLSFPILEEGLDDQRTRAMMFECDHNPETGCMDLRECKFNGFRGLEKSQKYAR